MQIIIAVTTRNPLKLISHYQIFLDKENSIRYFRKQSRDPDAINIFKIFIIFNKMHFLLCFIRDFIASFVTLTLKENLNYDYLITALRIEDAH